jgi:hypothetical protein
MSEVKPNFSEDVYRLRKPDPAHDEYRKLAKDERKAFNSDWLKWDVLYRGFRLQRFSTEHSHIQIKNEDGSEAPIMLRGSFTTWTRAMAQVDKYVSAVAKEGF